MANWLLDTNIVLYLLTRQDQLEKARALGPQAESHLRALYDALDRFLAERLDAGERLLLAPVVVLETLSVLQYSELFGLDPKQAAEALLTLVQAEEVECEEHECVTAALERQAAGEGSFTDAYLVCRARQEGVRLLTNDRRLAEAAGRKAIYLCHLAGG